MSSPLYDRIGTTYTSTRRPDRRRPDRRIGRAIHEALGDAHSVINVGAGADGYEPTDREVLDCADGFYGAFWRRPHAYLDPVVRAGISVFAQLDAGHVEHGIAALATDLESGAWERRHRDLLELEELSLGYYVVVAELAD